MAAASSNPASGKPYLNGLVFQFRLHFIRQKTSVPDEHFASNGSWKPPTLTSDVETIFAPSWMKWNQSGHQAFLTPIAGTQVNQNVVPSTASVFWSEETHRFVFCPYDCRVQNVRHYEARYGEGSGWQDLRFSHTQENPMLSILDFNGPYYFMSRAASPIWAPQLLPLDYGHPSPPPLPLNSQDQLRSCLAGKLCLLIALMVMSVPSNACFEPLKTSFHPPYWKPHTSPDGAGSKSHPFATQS